MSEIKVNKLSPRTGTTVTLGDSGDTITVPAGATFDSSSGTLTLPDGSVSLAKLSATGTKDATTFLRGDNTFASAGGNNTPAFLAKLSSNQDTTDLATTKIQFDTEVFDTDDCYDNSTNYRFTPTTAGKYFVYVSCIGRANAVSDLTNARVFIYKNGSEEILSHFDFRNNLGLESFNYIGVVIDFNGSSDYVEFFARIDHAGSGGVRAGSYFGAYKIIE